MRAFRTLFGMLILVSVAAGGYFAYQTLTQTTETAAPAAGRMGGGMFGGGPAPVIAVPVTRETFADRLEAIGTVQANESIVVTAKVQGVVNAINFDDGQMVTAGTDLVEFDDEELRARLQVELANLDEQRKQFERISGLAQANATSQARFDEQQAAVKKAEANVAAARARLEDYTIKAPFTGRLGNRRVSTGALVSPGTVITTLDDLSVVKLDFSVPENFLSSLREGLDIEATTTAYPGQVFRGRVTSIDTRIDPTTRSVSIRALLPNSDGLLRPGMLMVVDLIKDRLESLMIPEEALEPLDNQQYVWVVEDDNTVSRAQITIGRRRPGSVEVLEGLNLGDLVVTEGHQALSPGANVRLLNESEVRAGPPSATAAPTRG